MKRRKRLWNYEAVLFILKELEIMAQGRVKMERRQTRRFSLSQKVTYEVSAQQTSRQTVRQAGASKTVPRVSAEVLNVSDGGICLLTKGTLKTDQIIKVDLPLPVAKATASTIAEVRWISKGPGKVGHHAGLRFLL